MLFQIDIKQYTALQIAGACLRVMLFQIDIKPIPEMPNTTKQFESNVILDRYKT